MESILYLSYSNVSDGLVFPNELSEGVYSPGMWVLQSENINATNELYDFDAVDENKLIKLNLSKIQNNYFQVDTRKYGKINFRLHEIYYRYQNYVGNSNLINPHLKFFQLVPIDIPKLSNLCLEKGFFLVGKIDEEMNKASLQQRV
ncbi:hypothetical protein H3Z83_12780 [Tenacibaculum sp. S7007]|uniref:Uncharacterized protein n=1 Tax=Tenacibaculum pelagium TaxID=2759527 RepID=A0A839AQM6_9FLAO|nr:hypothetical protein [Tenacibaculum pelagium]MBA6157385.1 hypothetical protein [Tenacibaculum pelagium]